PGGGEQGDAHARAHGGGSRLLLRPRAAARRGQGDAAGGGPGERHLETAPPQTCKIGTGRLERGEKEGALIADRQAVAAQLNTRPRVLVPVLMGQMARPIISVGDALASAPGADGRLLALVDIRSGRDNEVFAQERRRRNLLLWVAGLEYSSDIRRRMGVSLRLTANVASSIRDAIAEYETTTLVLAWPTTPSARRHGVADLTRQLVPDGSTDVFFVRSNRRTQNQAVAPRSILATIRGGSGARVVAFAAAALADAYGSVLTLLHVQTGAQHPDRS